jgi:purine-binding chemotaxis protein CheW
MQKGSPNMFVEDDLDPIASQQLLEARAQVLAQPPQAAAQAQGQGFVVLQLGKEKYGVPIQRVQEIRTVSHLTRVPSTPSFYTGLVNLRGHLYPVLDLQSYLGLTTQETTQKSKLVLVSAQGLDVCILADQVLGIQWVTESEIQPLLTDESSHQRVVICGVTTNLLSILDLDALLSDPKLIVQDQAV